MIEKKGRTSSAIPVALGELPWDAGLSRREILKLAGYTSVAAFLAACGGSSGGGSKPASAPETIVVNSGGGTFQDAMTKAMLDPFQKATGDKVVYQSPDGQDAKVKAQVISGNVEWDVTDSSTLPFLPDVQKWLEPIDYSAFDKETLDNLYPQFKLKYGVCLITYSTGMAFSTKDWPAGKARPTTWAEFWDVQRFPGPRSLPTVANGDASTILFALLAAGVPKDKLYPLNLDKAFGMLDKIKPSIAKFWSVGAEPGQLLVDRGATMVAAWNGRIDDLKTKGAAVDFEWNQASVTPTFWVVPKGTKHKAAAMKFIAFVSGAKPQADLDSAIFYGPSNKKSFDLMDKSLAARLPTSPANFAKGFVPDREWLVKVTSSGKTNQQVMIDRWNSWVSQ